MERHKQEMQYMIPPKQTNLVKTKISDNQRCYRWKFDEEEIEVSFDKKTIRFTITNETDKYPTRYIVDSSDLRELKRWLSRDQYSHKFISWFGDSITLFEFIRQELLDELKKVTTNDSK